MQPHNKAVYLYCFARPIPLVQLSGAGVAGCGPLGTVDFPAASAVVSEVELEDFCGSKAENNLQDIAWLAPRACLHEKVIESAMKDSPVLPARFGTIFSSVERLESFARKHARAISQFLDRVSDQDEWAVKGLLEHGRAGSRTSAHEPQDSQNPRSSLPPGRLYLLERRMRAEAEKAQRLQLKETCLGIEDVLRRVATEFARRKVVSKSEVGKDVEVILKWAFLVARSSLAAFQERVEDMNLIHAPIGFTLHLTGPWPPYSFVPAFSDEDAPS